MNEPSGQYQILATLGQGRTSQVWLAEKLGPQGKSLRTVALKAMLSPGGGRGEMQRRAALFRHEIAVNAQLEHHNVVRVDGWGTGLFGCAHFIEMQRVRGLSLRDLLDRRGAPLPPRDIAWIGMQAAAGLRYAHNYAHGARAEAQLLGTTRRTVDGQSGFAHCGLSPTSIMVDVEGEVKITDWSSAHPLDASGNGTLSQVTTGRGPFMPPEQGRGRISDRTDVYSLGFTLAIALSSQGIPASSTPPALQALLESMMHVDPERRPHTNALVEHFYDVMAELGSHSHDAQRAFGARVQEHYQEPRRRPRLRLIQGGRSCS